MSKKNVVKVGENKMNKKVGEEKMEKKNVVFGKIEINKIVEGENVEGNKNKIDWNKVFEELNEINKREGRKGWFFVREIVELMRKYSKKDLGRNKFYNRFYVRFNNWKKEGKIEKVGMYRGRRVVKFNEEYLESRG